MSLGLIMDSLRHYVIMTSHLSG